MNRRYPNLMRLFAAVILMAVTGFAHALASVSSFYQEPALLPFHNDIAGNPIAATDSNGNILWKENFRPFGERLNNEAAAVNNRQWFHRKAADAETGLSYFGARYYDPVIGRFMGVDAVGVQEGNLHSFNRYAYGNGNPFKFVDPDGNLPVLIIPALIWAGQALSVAGVGVTAYETTTVLRNVAVGDMTAGAAVRQELPGIAVGVALGVTGKVISKTVDPAGAAAAARDVLAESLSSLKGKAPATVTGGYNTKTGEVAARACGGGKCAEAHVVDALGGKKADVRFTKAKRPRTGEEVPVCPNCEASYGRDSFPSGTKFKTDGK